MHIIQMWCIGYSLAVISLAIQSDPRLKKAWHRRLTESGSRYGTFHCLTCSFIKPLMYNQSVRFQRGHAHFPNTLYSSLKRIDTAAAPPPALGQSVSLISCSIDHESNILSLNEIVVDVLARRLT